MNVTPKRPPFEFPPVELVRLIVAQVVDSLGRPSAASGAMTARAQRVAAERHAMAEDWTTPREAKNPASITKRDPSNARRRPKVRRGSARLDFDGPIVHATHVQNIIDEDTVRLERLDGKPEAAPEDWPAALAARLVGAKLAVLAYVDESRNGTIDLPGVPNPRGPANADIVAGVAGLLVRRGDMEIFYGRGEAHPGVIRAQLAANGFPIPASLSNEAISWLVEIISADSGGAGQIAQSTVAHWLRSPKRLGAELMRRAGNNRAFKSVAAKLPRSAKWRP
jgi:hypothetical protein